MATLGGGNDMPDQWLTRRLRHSNKLISVVSFRLSAPNGVVFSLSLASRHFSLYLSLSRSFSYSLVRSHPSRE